MSPRGSMLVVAHRSCLLAEAASRAACDSVLMVAHRFRLPIESSSRAATWLCARGGSLVLHPLTEAGYHVATLPIDQSCNIKTDNI
jgi:hypothetical protein